MIPVLEGGEETLIGGQAVMEGVMMRAPHSYCVAVRRADGSMLTDEMPVRRVSEAHPAFRYPVLRGIGMLGQALWLGIKALRFSANAALEGQSPAGRRNQEISSWAMGLNLAFSFGFFIFLYKFVPLYLTTAIANRLPAVDGHVLFNLTDGLIRIAIFLGFLYLISRWKDIRRVFEYHGAEHKTVFNFESGLPLSVENAQKFARYHPRCGTSFLLVVMVIAMAVYALVPAEGFLMRFAARVAFLPVIAGTSYELIRFAARHRGGLMTTLTAPGLWLQRITTQPPSDEQTEVAIHALRGAMALELKQGGALVIA